MADTLNQAEEAIRRALEAEHMVRGDWHTSESDTSHGVHDGVCNVVAVCSPANHMHPDADLALSPATMLAIRNYIATVSPINIRALLSELDRLRSALEEKRKPFVCPACGVSADEHGRIVFQSPPGMDEATGEQMQKIYECFPDHLDASGTLACIGHALTYTWNAAVQWARAQDADARDAARLDWLEANCQEEPLNARAFDSELAPDLRLKHKLPVLISTTCVGGTVSLRDAIDSAMAQARKEGGNG